MHQPSAGKCIEDARLLYRKSFCSQTILEPLQSAIEFIVFAGICANCIFKVKVKKVKYQGFLKKRTRLMLWLHMILLSNHKKGIEEGVVKVKINGFERRIL